MIEAGMAAPSFELYDADGKLWRLGDLRGRKVILFFYPADDTPGCTIQACDFRDSKRELQDAGYIVLGVSPQGAQSHKAFAAKFDLNFPLLIDEDLKVANAYGVYEERGDWNGVPLVIKRSTFVIDEKGALEHVLVGVGAKGHVGELKRIVGVAT